MNAAKSKILIKCKRVQPVIYRGQINGFGHEVKIVRKDRGIDWREGSVGCKMSH